MRLNVTHATIVDSASVRKKSVLKREALSRGRAAERSASNEVPRYH